VDKIRLVIADDHPLILAALAGLLRTDEGFEIVAACTQGSEALEAVRRHRPDVLVIDLRMPGVSGLEVVRKLAAEGLQTRTVLLTAMIDDGEMMEAVRLGVNGVVLKAMAAASIVQCVRKVHSGEPWLERRSVSRALEKLVRRVDGVREIAGLLTPREMEMVQMIGRGLRNKEIAGEMSITEQTVKVHLSHIYAKLGVDGRLALLRYAEDKGLL